MKKIIIWLALLTVTLVGCCGGGSQNVAAQEPVQTSEVILTDAAHWDKVYRKIAPTEIEDNAIDLISNQWMLVTSGSAGSFNTMTASWGALGEVWGYDVSMITIRNTRYTNQFLEKNDIYTLSFFDEQYRPKLQMLGTKSGRDTDKIKESELTPVATPAGSMSFGQARMIIECRKLYAGPLSQEYMAAEIAAKYANQAEGHHLLYIGQIVNVWIK